MDLWDAGSYDSLVHEIVGWARQKAGGSQGNVDPERKARTFNSMVLDGKVRAAVHSLTNRNGGGVLLPEDPCTKTG